MNPIRIIDIPPYQRAGVNYDPAEGHFMMKELVSNLRANAQLYGLSHKVTSVRYVSRSSTYTMALVRKYPKAQRLGAPEIQQ